jgi:hypothetical protein
MAQKHSACGSWSEFQLKPNRPTHSWCLVYFAKNLIERSGTGTLITAINRPGKILDNRAWNHYTFSCQCSHHHVRRNGPIPFGVAFDTWNLIQNGRDHALQPQPIGDIRIVSAGCSQNSFYLHCHRMIALYTYPCTKG